MCLWCVCVCVFVFPPNYSMTALILNLKNASSSVVLAPTGQIIEGKLSSTEYKERERALGGLSFVHLLTTFKSFPHFYSFLFYSLSLSLSLFLSLSVQEQWWSGPLPREKQKQKQILLSLRRKERGRGLLPA